MFKLQNNSKKRGCAICGKAVMYSTYSANYTCQICGKKHEANSACVDGHYVCDRCHSSALPDVMRLLKNTDEKDPITLFNQIAALGGVHMHGPEHHTIVPGVMLVAYRNNGGTPSAEAPLDFNAALKTAARYGGQLPGGICGSWGACGAAIGAGAYAALIMESNPLKAEVWSAPQRLTSKCLERIAEYGGVRCCKRTSKISIELAVEFTREHKGIDIPIHNQMCDFSDVNQECLGGSCPYFGG